MLLGFLIITPSDNHNALFTYEAVLRHHSQNSIVMSFKSAEKSLGTSVWRVILIDVAI